MADTFRGGLLIIDSDDGLDLDTIRLFVSICKRTQTIFKNIALAGFAAGDGKLDDPVKIAARYAKTLYEQLSWGSKDAFTIFTKKNGKRRSNCFYRGFF